MIEPIRRGARGSAVEDVQKRLLMLGYDLGPTGVDGVFQGATWDAVRGFQSANDLAEDGIVGTETWAALVDATFRLGDRLLYLKYPYFHGHDVATLQGALNALGFSCGQPDGIFGAFTERAVREFQANVGQADDGIVGIDTVRAVDRLKHVWQDKDPAAPVALRVAAVRSGAALAKTDVMLHGIDSEGRSVAERIANLAVASEPRSKMRSVEQVEAGRPGVVIVHLAADVGQKVLGHTPRLTLETLDDAALEPRLLTALSAVPGSAEVMMDLGAGLLADDEARQRVAVRVLDALCSALPGLGDLW